jgi:protein-tyrosine phosphatase
MKTEPHWIAGPWAGRLAIAPRPRGHDWLADELRHWHRSGVDAVVSLLTLDEVASFGLDNEQQVSRESGMEFDQFPIADRSTPPAVSSASDLIARIESRLQSGRSVLIHCRQGIGRAATIAIAALIHAGIELDDAIAAVAQARGRPVPETPEQLRWLREYAETVAPTATKSALLLVHEQHIRHV